MDAFRDGRDFLPGAAVRFSAASASGAAALHRYLLQQLREDSYTYTSHMLVWARSGSGSIEWRCRGRRGQYRVQPGELIFQPAEEFSHRGWLRGVDCVVLHLPRAALPEAVEPADWPERVGWRAPLLTGLLAASLHQAEDAGAWAPYCLEEWAARLRPALTHALGLPTSLPRTPPGRLSAGQLEAVFALIDRRQPGQLTLAELARSADCSGAIQFLRGFRRTLGVTPYEYLVRRRVDAARTLLETGQANVGEAAAALGFSDQSHLVRQFRRRYGQPPSAFLRRTARSFKAPDAPGRRL